MLWDEASGTRFPVLYWENSIGRSKSCDIYLPDATASRDHGGAAAPGRGLVYLRHGF